MEALMLVGGALSLLLLAYLFFALLFPEQLQ